MSRTYNFCPAFLEIRTFPHIKYKSCVRILNLYKLNINGEWKREFDYTNKEVSRMSERDERKEFVEPQLIKCEEPLDKVTMGLGYCLHDCDNEG